jgi:hypothetical protein
VIPIVILIRLARCRDAYRQRLSRGGARGLCRTDLGVGTQERRER